MAIFVWVEAELATNFVIQIFCLIYEYLQIVSKMYFMITDLVDLVFGLNFIRFYSMLFNFFVSKKISCPKSVLS